MSWKQLVGAGTWLGAAVAAGVLLAGLGVGSLMLLRGVIPENGMRTVVGVVSAERKRRCPAAGAGGVRLRVRCHVAGGADGRGGAAVRGGRADTDLRRVGWRPAGGGDRREAAEEETGGASPS